MILRSYWRVTRFLKRKKPEKETEKTEKKTCLWIYDEKVKKIVENSKWIRNISRSYFFTFFCTEKLIRASPTETDWAPWNVWKETKANRKKKRNTKKTEMSRKTTKKTAERTSKESKISWNIDPFETVLKNLRKIFETLKKTTSFWMTSLMIKK